MNKEVLFIGNFSIVVKHKDQKIEGDKTRAYYLEDFLEAMDKTKKKREEERKEEKAKEPDLSLRGLFHSYLDYLSNNPSLSMFVKLDFMSIYFFIIFCAFLVSIGALLLVGRRKEAEENINRIYGRRL